MDSKRHSIFSNLLFWIKYYLKYERQIFWISVAVIVLNPLFHMLALYFPKVTLALVEGQVPPERLAWVLGGYTLLYLAARGIYYGLVAYNDMTLNRERQKVVFRIFLKSLRINYGFAESEEGRDTFRKVVGLQNMGDSSASSQFVYITRTLVGTVLCFVLYSTVLGQLSPWMMLVLLMLAVLGYLLDLRENRFRNSIRQEEAVINKHYYYMKAAMGQTSAAKDIRIFGMGTWLRERMGHVLEAQERLGRRAALWSWKNGFWGRLLDLLRDLGHMLI